jgi:hypothetical protein
VATDSNGQVLVESAADITLLTLGVGTKNIYSWFHDGNGPEKTTDTSYMAWGDIASGHSEVSALINQAVRDSNAAWEGAGADAARSATSPLATWSDMAGSSAQSASYDVASLSGAFRTAQNSVQKPVDVPDKPWLNDMAWWETDYDEAVEKSQTVNNANMQALNIYASTANSVSSSMPTFESPNASDATLDSDTSSSIDSGNGNRNGNIDSSGTGTGIGTGTGTGTGRGTGTADINLPGTGNGTGSGTGTGGGSGGSDGSLDPSWNGGGGGGTTNPSQNTPNVQLPGIGNPNNPNNPGLNNPNFPGVLPGIGDPRTSNSGNTRLPGMGGPGGGGRGGGGGGGAGGNVKLPGMGGPGSGVSGTGGGFGPRGGPGATAGVVAGDDGVHGRGAGGIGAAGAAGRAGGAAGGMGAGGMGAGAARGQGDEDKEHKSAAYLVETEDVFGDGQLVAPPVIGDVR